MKLVARLGICTAALALCAPSAHAQEPGKRLDTAGRRDDVALMFAKISDCMVKDHPNIVRRWLSLLPGSKAEDQYVSTQVGAMTVCMELGDSRVTTRANLAYEAAEIRPFLAASAARSVARRAAATLPFEANAPAWFVEPLKSLAETDPVNRVALIQQDFGHCVMVANWQASVALVRSEAGTKDEDAAIAALVPALGPCVQAGTTVSLTKSAVRKAINEPFYHAVADARQEATK